MKRWSSAQLLRAAEFMYATLGLFALTQGPVYRIWSGSADEIERLPEPSMAHIYFASFVAIQVPALLLWFRRMDRSWWSSKSNQSLGVFLSWISLTVVWSTFSRHSFPEIVALLLTAVFGMYLSSCFTSREFWGVITSAMALGVGLSWVAVMRLWEGAVNFQENYWIGIYYNRNSLAPVTAVAIIGIIGVILTADKDDLRRTSISRVLAVSAAFVIGIFAAIELWKSQSQTSPLALLVAMLAVVLWLLIRFLMGRVKMLHRARQYAASIALLVTGIVLFLALRAVGGFGGVSSETASLNSRRALWDLSWNGIQEKPFLGWGWMAAWRDSEFFLNGVWWATWDSVWSHNGYHDLLLGGGVFAALFFGSYLWLSVGELSNERLRLSSPRLLLAAFVLVAATQESFFVGSHFAWGLLVAALSSNSTRAESTEQDKSNTTSP
jgi:O-antigen ligase